MPKLFPVIKKKKITVIQSGGGPNPTDDFRIGIKIADTSPALIDAMSVAFGFPDTIPAQTDLVKLGLSFTDTNPELADQLLRLGLGFADTSPALSDNLNLGIAFSDSNPSLSDLVKLAFTLADSNPALADLFGLKFGFTDSFAGLSDSVGFVVRPTYGDSNAAPTDALTQLKIQPITETNDAPTDARSAEAVFLGNATTVPAATNWVNPANAQGARNGTNATLTDTAINQLSGTLTATVMEDPLADFSTWTITKVEILWWVGATLSIATTSRVHMEWQYDGGIWRIPDGGENIGGSTTGTKSTTFDRLPLATPLVFDITAEAPWDWTNLDTVASRVRFVSAIIAETATITVDAFGLRVTATKDPL